MIVTLSAGHYGGLTVQWPADAKRVRIEDAQGQGWIYTVMASAIQAAITANGW